MAQRAKKIAEENSHHDCDFRDMLSRVGDKWSLLVIFILKGRPAFRARFSDLKRSIPGISQRMLTATVRNLERDGMLTRHVYAEVPPRVEYELTPLGRGLTEPVLGLALVAAVELAGDPEARAIDLMRESKSPERSPAPVLRLRSTGSVAIGRDCIVVGELRLASPTFASAPSKVGNRTTSRFPSPTRGGCAPKRRRREGGPRMLRNGKRLDVAALSAITGTSTMPGRQRTLMDRTDPELPREPA